VRRAPVLLPAVALALTSAVALAAPPRVTSTCAEDDAVPTPPGYAGWERSSVVAWEAMEAQGGIVPDIEEDRAHAPPAWWRYPSPLRSAELLAEEAKNPKGLYTRVAPGDLKAGDLLVRARGAGACGKMAVVVGLAQDQWMTIEAEGDPDAGAENKKTNNPVFFDGRNLRPEAGAYRIAVKKDSSLGHVRELARDLKHLERTIGERPPLIVPKGRAAVEEKVHDLVDEAASLAADPPFEAERRVLTGRALALAAALDWPGAAAAAKAVLDDALHKKPLDPEIALARARVHLLAGESAQAAELAESAAALPDVPPRVHYLAGRALIASGKTAPGLAEIKRYLDEDPADPRARKLLATGGREPAMGPPPAPNEELAFSATPDKVALHAKSYGFDLAWPIAWRIVGQSAVPGAGLVVEFSTERVLRDDGEAERATASLLVQRPGAAEAAALARKGAKNIFPDAKLKTLPPLIPGTRREQFKERAQGAQHMGEVTTVERGGTVVFLVLNASPATYPKLKDEYAAFVKSLKLP
jgi:tetratricopeptide (TPR) repeat protein